ncbi:hypothetical protein NXS19_014029 [Fusarium pseudograminearum]|nr:hypothetical protein NXS19_014029 [Fusarium pseudograminearum]
MDGKVLKSAFPALRPTIVFLVLISNPKLSIPSSLRLSSTSYHNPAKALPQASKTKLGILRDAQTATQFV